MKNKLHSIRFKMILAFSVTTFIAILIVGLVIIGSANKSIGRIIDDQSTQITESIKHYISSSSETALNLAVKYAADNEIVRQYLEQDRNQFAKIIEPLFLNLNEDSSVSLFEFGDDNGVVFLRGHNLKKYGDDKSSKPPIQEALKGHAVAGLEFGSSGIAIRAFAPIKNNNEVVGTLQLGLDNDFVGELGALTQSDIVLYEGNELVAASHTEESILQVFEEQGVIAYNSLAEGNEDYQLISDDKEVLHLVPLYDPTGAKLIGMVGFYKEFTVASNFEKNNTMILIILLIAGLIISITLGFLISGMVSKPVNILVGAANRLADGDLSVEIDIKSKDELGQLANKFTTMAMNINTVLSNISSASDEVAAGSTQLSDSSMALSQGATEQASSVQELAASIEQIATQTKNNANNATKAKGITETTREQAKLGNEQMTTMLLAMKEINDSSNNISKIIKVIDDIAFQTNILALNAAVEAARAGQHGKGFAVVAEEVRNLAARSASAAKETTDMIESSINKVEDGTKTANSTAEALNQIVLGISEAAELVSSIAEASNEQAQGVEQINKGLTQISDVVQTTSATAEETASASEELSSQADMLMEQVATFKLRKKAEYTTGKISDEILEMLEHLKNSNGSVSSSNNGPVRNISLSDSEFEKY